MAFQLLDQQVLLILKQRPIMNKARMLLNDMSLMNIADIDLNLLKTFEALHDESSASRAAVRLGVTQSGQRSAPQLRWHSRPV